MILQKQIIFSKKKIGVLLTLTFILFTSVIQAQQIELRDFRTLGKLYKEKNQHFLSYIYNSSFYFLSSKDNNKLSAGLDAFKSCLLYNRHSEAEMLIKDMNETYPEFHNELLYYYSFNLTSMKFFDYTEMYLNEFEGYNNRKGFLKSYTFLHQNKVEESLVELRKIDSSFKYSDEVSQIESLLNNKPNFKKRYKTISFLLSAMLPGSGQLYAGSTFDALNSFIFNSISGIATYTSWRYELSKNKNERTYVLPIISSTVFSTFYLTNLYNAVNLTEKSNLFRESKFYDKILERFNLIISDKKYFLNINLPLQ